MDIFSAWRAPRESIQRGSTLNMRLFYSKRLTRRDFCVYAASTPT